MEISRLTIKNFRGVQRAELDFKGHARATSSRNFIKTRARRCGFVAAQAACAAIASSPAARTSAFEARGTREITSPVKGSKPSQKRTDVPLACLPPMKWVSSFIAPVLPSRNRPAVSRLTVQRLTGRRHLLQPQMKALHLISIPRASPRTLAEKGVDPCRSVLVGHVAGHRLARDVVGCFEGVADLTVEGPLAEGDSRSATRDDKVSESAQLGIERLGRDDPVDEAPRLRCPRVDRLAGEE